MQRICWFLLVAAVAVLSAQPQGQEREARLGAELAKDELRRSTKVENAEVQDYVDGLARRLAQQFPLYAHPFTVAILQNDRVRTLEPRTLPAGYVFVQASHILEARSEDELVGVLAHAMAHIVQRHGVRVESAKMPLIFLGPWDGPALLPESMLSAARQFHLEADRIAAQVMADAGYDPRALAAFIDRTQPVPRSAVFSALPTKEQRVVELSKTIEALPARAYIVHEGLAKIQATLRASLP